MHDKIFWFDLETTGVNVATDRIVQIAALKTDLDYNKIGDPKNLLINPEMEIPAGATKVHGITNEMVVGKPKFKQVAQAVADFMTGCILGGYNIKSFDVPLLAEEFERAGIFFNFRNVEYVDSYNIFTKNEPRTLSAAHKFYTGETFENAHDALADNEATINVAIGQSFMYGFDIKQMIENSHHDKIYFDLDRKIQLVEDQPIYSFGKDKGKSLLKEPGFARWMLDQTFITRQTKRVINELLATLKPAS